MMQKTKMVGILLLFLFSTAYLSIFNSTIAFGDENRNNIELVDPQTQPSSIHVGDSFKLSVLVVNNSPDTIRFYGGCSSPLSASFDKNVVGVDNLVACLALTNITLKPGEKMTVAGPSSNISYTASATGITNATLSFSYQIGENTSKTISKTFSFTISEKTPPQNSDRVFVRFSNMTSTSMNSFSLISGWSLVESKGTLFLLSQDSDGKLKRELFRFTPSSSSCYYYQNECIDGTITISNSDRFLKGNTVHIEIDRQNQRLFLSSSIQQLVFDLDKIRTWPQNQENGGIFVTLSEGQREGPLLVQKIFSNSVTGLDFREYPLATNIGMPVTLHIGESASNGCTVELTLVKISGSTATFQKKEYQNRPCPICLSENTVIDTPNGPVNVKELKDGMIVWTQDISGNKYATTILKTGKTLVPPTHKMVHIILDDKRELYVSPNHPTADGRLFVDLLAGDTLDGSQIKSAELIPYNGTYTYDILPSGQTGFYWADGILVKSTLK